ncbi:MAG: sensor histidine kinase [Pseudobdellovibrionaceae bacterium]
MDQLDANIKNPNTKIEVDVPSHLNIFADEVKMQQAFTALLKNAFQAAQVALEAWVKITANALPGSQQISIQIQDSGSGIKPEVAEKMMIPFFTTKDIGQGTGLGLSIAKGVFEQHEGQLEYLATEKNTTFNVTLPTTTIDLTAASPISINSDIPSQAA